MEDEFYEEMLRLYTDAVAVGYTPSRFLDMVRESGGVGAAKRLLDSPDISDGFTRLWHMKRLDLTVEAVVVRPIWWSLFSPEQIATAGQRLEDAGYME